jgi:hypothetical protein
VVFIDNAQFRVANLSAKGIPNTINCTSGKIIDAIISAGKKKTYAFRAR